MKQLTSAYFKSTGNSFAKALTIASDSIKNGSKCIAQYHLGLFNEQAIQDKSLKEQNFFLNWKLLWKQESFQNSPD